jgi:hypothetical protein
MSEELYRDYQAEIARRQRVKSAEPPARRLLQRLSERVRDGTHAVVHRLRFGRH